MLKQFRVFLLGSCLGLIILLGESCASRAVYVRAAPPASQNELRPTAPFPGAVWQAGYWHWGGGKYVWVAGRWVRPKHGKTWIAGFWQQTPRGWRWQSDHWQK